MGEGDLTFLLESVADEKHAVVESLRIAQTSMRMSNTTKVELEHGQTSVVGREQRSMITDLHHIGIETNGDRSVVRQPLSHF